jgi:hypothetical protein
MVAALCCGLGVTLIPRQAVADEAQSPASSDDWSFNIAPYVWAASLKGSIAPFPRAPTADVDVSFKDIFENLDIAGMAFAEVRYQRFGGYADLIYTSISADADTPFGVLFDDIDAENEIFIGTFGGSYRVNATEHASLDLLAGARVWSVDTEVRLQGGLLPNQKFENDESWADPVIGIHGLYRFDNGIFITSFSHVGGFGVGSHLTWDTFGALGYQFNDSISAVAGYRHLKVDYEHKGFVFDVELSGPVIGMTIRF